ncbi:MAG: hypothetical protein JJU10_05485 [Idiomarina sp.]|nr:hypothetical protein [Idiomarina sp.]
MLKVTKQFKASEDGVTVVAYPVGEYESLPEVALSHAKAIGALEDNDAAKEAEAKAAAEAKAKAEAEEEAKAKAEADTKAEDESNSKTASAVKTKSGKGKA